MLDFAPVLAKSDELLDGALGTLLLTGTTLAIAMPAALLLASMTSLGNKAVRTVIRAYIELIRNTPLLAQLFFVFFGLPVLGVRVRPDTTALIVLSVYGTAYLIEIVRAGIESIPRGQVEAARALGLSLFNVFRYVIFKPALRTVYPALTSQFIMLLLTSSVVTAISAHELTHAAQLIQSITFRSFEVFLLVAVIYFALSSFFSLLFSALEKLLFSYPMAR